MFQSCSWLLACICLILVASSDTADLPISGSAARLRTAVENNLEVLSVGCGLQLVEYAAELGKVTPWAMKSMFVFYFIGASAFQSFSVKCCYISNKKLLLLIVLFLQQKIIFGITPLGIILNLNQNILHNFEINATSAIPSYVGVTVAMFVNI